MDSCRDVADSLLQRSSSRADWVRKFYAGGPRNSENPSKYFLRKDDYRSEDIEIGPKAEENDLTYNLFLYTQLVNQMGFDPEMVKSVLIYDKDIIKDELSTAIDLLVKTEYGWSHTFIPEIDSRTPQENIDPFPGLDIEERCLICGDPRHEHRKTIIKGNFIPFLESLPKVNNDFQELSEEAEDEDDESEKFMCNVCYGEHDLTEEFSLGCGHQFCRPCLRNMITVNINEGKVAAINCAFYGCELTYSKDDIEQLVTDQEILEKYSKFRENYEVNLDSNRQWCPEPNCDLWVQGSVSNRRVQCGNGHIFCFICQNPWHKGSCKDQLENQLLDYVSSNRVAKCPQCNIRTEKNEGCNHMSCICGYQWCWICK